MNQKPTREELAQELMVAVQTAAKALQGRQRSIVLAALRFLTVETMRMYPPSVRPAVLQDTFDVIRRRLEEDDHQERAAQEAYMSNKEEMRVAMIRATIGQDSLAIFDTLLELANTIYRNASPQMKNMFIGMLLGVLQRDYGIDVRATWNRATKSAKPTTPSTP